MGDREQFPRPVRNEQPDDARADGGRGGRRRGRGVRQVPHGGAEAGWHRVGGRVQPDDARTDGSGHLTRAALLRTF